jgi:4-amino-4-deoxychorismate lyase
MGVLVDGREDGRIDPQDRGLNYGDGLFETLAMRDGVARFFDWHLERLAAGAARLGIPLPDRGLLQQEVSRAWPAGRGVVRVVLTRGSGPRGYRPPPDLRPLRILTGSPWPLRDPGNWTEGVRLRWCSTRLGRNPRLAGIKHLNRLEQVLARAEWDDDAVAEGLMMDDLGNVIGGTQTNLFAVFVDGVVTPALDQCGVAGVMRRAFMRWAAGQGITLAERPLPAGELAGARGLILTNALIGAWPVRELEGRGIPVDGRAAAFNEWLERR